MGLGSAIVLTVHSPRISWEGQPTRTRRPSGPEIRPLKGPIPGAAAWTDDQVVHARGDGVHVGRTDEDAERVVLLRQFSDIRLLRNFIC